MAKSMEFNIIMGATVAGALNGLSKMSNAMKNTSKGMNDLAKKSQELQKMQKNLEKFGKLKTDYVRVGKDLVEATSKLRKLQEAYKKTGSSNTELAKKIQEQEKVVVKLNKQKERQKQLFQATKNAIEAEGGSLEKYKKRLSQVSTELERSNKLKGAQNRYEMRQETLGKVKDFGDRSFNRGIATAGALSFPVKLAVDLEESKADLRKMVSAEELNKLAPEIRKISEKSPMSQAKVYEMAGALSQSGIKEDLVAYTEQANKIAVAFDMDAKSAGDFLAKTGAQLNLQGKELFAYSDAINHMSDNSASRAAELADISSRVGGIAKGAGVSKSALLGLGATAVSFGKTSEQASTGLKNFFSALTKGEATSKKAQGYFRNIGIDVNKLAVDMQKDGEGTILKVLEKIKQFDPAKQGALISTIFGEEAKPVVQDMVNNIDKVKENLKEAKKGFNTDAVNKEYNNRTDTPLNKMLTTKNKVMNSMADLGSALIPTITSALQALDPLIVKVSQFVQKNPQLTAGIMKSVAGFAALSLGIGGATKVFGPLFSIVSKGMLVFDKFKAAGSFSEGFQTAFPTLSKFAGMLGKLGKFSFKGIGKIGSVVVKGLMGVVRVAKMVGLAIKTAFLANPVGVIIGAIVAVVAIMVILYNKNKAFRNFVNNMWKNISQTAIQAWNKIKPAVTQFISSAIQKFHMFVFKVRATWGKIASYVKQAMDKLKPIVTGVLNVLKVLFIGHVKSIGNTFKLILSVAKGVFQMISSSFRTTIAVWKGIFQVFVAFFTGKWNEIPGIVSGVWESVKSGISGFVKGAKSILSGLFTWFKDQWNNLKSMASNIPVIGGVIGKNYAGTNYWRGGLTTVAERGAELIKIPGKPAFLAQSEMLLNLPRGTQILNNSQTRSTLRSNVDSLKERMKNVGVGSQQNVGDNITIQVNVNGSGNNIAQDIAREVKRVVEELQNKKRRVEIT